MIWIIVLISFFSVLHGPNTYVHLTSDSLEEWCLGVISAPLTADIYEEDLFDYKWGNRVKFVPATGIHTLDEVVLQKWDLVKVFEIPSSEDDVFILIRFREGIYGWQGVVDKENLTIFCFP